MNVQERNRICSARMRKETVRRQWASHEEIAELTKLRLEGEFEESYIARYLAMPLRDRYRHRSNLPFNVTVCWPASSDKNIRNSWRQWS